MKLLEVDTSAKLGGLEQLWSRLDAFYSFTDLLRQLPLHNWEKLLTRMLYHHEETAHNWVGVNFTAQIQPGFNPFERFQRNKLATA